MPEHARVPVRPVKGQVLRLRDPRGAGLVERTIRGEHAYLVPRGDGALRARRDDGGARVGHDADRGRRLRARCATCPRSCPASSSSTSRSSPRACGPATPDNLPAIGPGALEGLVWATGHYRNGILLTPVTADLVAGALAGEPAPEWAAPADPLRFAGVPA